jgi:hypothetical protein
VIRVVDGDTIDRRAPTHPTSKEAAHPYNRHQSAPEREPIGFALLSKKAKALRLQGFQ